MERIVETENDIVIDLSDHDLRVWDRLGWRASPTRLGFEVSLKMKREPLCVEALRRIDSYINNKYPCNRAWNIQAAVDDVLIIAQCHPDKRLSCARQGSAIHNAYVKLGCIIYCMMKQ